jgi:hypothetical protein
LTGTVGLVPLIGKYITPFNRSRVNDCGTIKTPQPAATAGIVARTPQRWLA